MAFKITTKTEDDIALVSVEGEIDMFTSPNLRDTLLPFFTPKTRGVIVDLSKVGFMDSSGIATLVEGLQWSKKQGRAFILAGLGSTVHNALSLTKLDNVFSIAADAKTALSELNA